MDSAAPDLALNQSATLPPAAGLSEADIALVIRHPNADIRAGAVQRLCRHVRSAKLTDAERARARTVLAHIARDVAELVRRALAVTLKNSPELPHDVAIMLINDIDSIAVPVLETSPVLTDEDLLDVLRSKAAAKVLAVARRPSLSGSLVRAVIRFGDSAAVAGLAANDHAPLDEAAYREILALRASDDLIEESLVARRDLPPFIIEQLITHASENVAIALSKRHEIPLDLALTLAHRTRERATVDFIDQSWLARDVHTLVERLMAQDRLTTSLILRAACCGQMRFTEHALAVRAGVSHAKAALMIHEGGVFGLRTLGRQARIDEISLHTLRGAVAVFRDLEIGGIDYDRAYFQRLMIERVLTLPVKFTEADAAYLLEKLDGLDFEVKE